MIYIFGDSHSSAFTINNNNDYMHQLHKLYIKNNFSSFRTQPYTCYNLFNKINNIDNFLHH